MYESSAGTSLAAPQVAGVAALLRSINNNFTPAEIENIIKSTTDPIADAAKYPGELGTGRVNAYKAVLAAVNIACPTTTLAGTQPPPPSTNKRVVCKEIKLQNVTVPSDTSLKLKATGGAITIDANTRFRVEAGARFTVE